MSSQSASSQVKPVTPSLKSNPFFKELINCFRSVHLAIVLLSLMALGTIIGVVMPQIGMVELAEIKAKYGANFEFFNTLGFFNVYSSFWFITLEVLFFFNLLIGSFKWLRPATLAAIQKTFIPASLMVHKPEAYSLPALSNEAPDVVEAKLSHLFKQFRYTVHRDANGNLYACKGNITRIGPSIAHLGILLVLVAGVYGSFTGFKAEQLIIPGDTFAVPNATNLMTNIPEPLWMGSVPNYTIHVKDFEVEYYQDRPDVAKQYHSDLQVFTPDGKLIREQSISVNHPLFLDNLSVYQASFAPTGRFFLTVNGKPRTVEINNNFNDRPISINPMEDGSTLIMFPFFKQQDPGVKENHAIFFVRKPDEQIAEGTMPPNIRLEEGQTGALNGVQITYKEPEMLTGLQIKQAPEVPLMYLAYLIIGIGTVLCFFSQRQVWIALREVTPGKTEVMIHPKTNKAWLSFRKELLKLQDAMQQVLTPSLVKKDA